METPDPILLHLAELEDIARREARWNQRLAMFEALQAEAEFVAMQEAHDLHQAQQAAYDDAQWGL